MNATLRMWKNRIDTFGNKIKRGKTPKHKKVGKTLYGNTLECLAESHKMTPTNAYSVMLLGYVVMFFVAFYGFMQFTSSVNPDSIATPKELQEYSKGKPLDDIACVNNRIKQIGTNVTYREIDVMFEICKKESLLKNIKGRTT